MFVDRFSTVCTEVMIRGAEVAAVIFAAALVVGVVCVWSYESRGSSDVVVVVFLLHCFVSWIVWLFSLSWRIKILYAFVKQFKIYVVNMRSEFSIFSNNILYF